MWLFDWNTGNWTAYEPNELVCAQCDTCGSSLANQLGGSTFIKADNGTYIACNNATSTDKARGESLCFAPFLLAWGSLLTAPSPPQALWLGLSGVSRSYGAFCAYHITWYAEGSVCGSVTVCIGVWALPARERLGGRPSFSVLSLTPIHRPVPRPPPPPMSSQL